MEKFSWHPRGFEKRICYKTILLAYGCTCTCMCMDVWILQVVRRRSEVPRIAPPKFHFLQGSNNTFIQDLKIHEYALIENITKHTLILNNMEPIYLGKCIGF